MRENAGEHTAISTLIHAASVLLDEAAQRSAAIERFDLHEKLSTLRIECRAESRNAMRTYCAVRGCTRRAKWPGETEGICTGHAAERGNQRAIQESRLPFGNLDL